MKLNNLQSILLSVVLLSVIASASVLYFLSAEREQLQTIICADGSRVVLPRTEAAAQKWISDETSRIILKLTKQGEDILAEAQYGAKSDIEGVINALRKEDVILREAMIEATKARFSKPCDGITEQNYWAVVHAVIGKQVNLITIRESVTSGKSVTRSSKAERFLKEFDYYRFGEL